MRGELSEPTTEPVNVKMHVMRSAIAPQCLTLLRPLATRGFGLAASDEGKPAAKGLLRNKVYN